MARPRSTSRPLTPSGALVLPVEGVSGLDVADGHWAVVTEGGALVLGTLAPLAMDAVYERVLDGARAVALLPEAGCVVVVGDEAAGTVRALRDGSSLGRLEPGGHSHWVHDVCALPGGLDFATASHDGTVRIWRVGRDGIERTQKVEAGIRPRALAAHPRGGHVLVTGDDRVVRAISLERGEVVHAFSRVDPATGEVEQGGWAHSSPYVTMDGAGRTLLWEDLDGGVARWDFKSGAREGHYDAMGCQGAAFVGEGRVAALEGRGALRLFDRESSACLARVAAHEQGCALQTIGDGELLTAGVEGTLIRWRVQGRG